MFPGEYGNFFPSAWLFFLADALTPDTGYYDIYIYMYTKCRISPHCSRLPTIERPAFPNRTTGFRYTRRFYDGPRRRLNNGTRYIPRTRRAHTHTHTRVRRRPPSFKPVRRRRAPSPPPHTHISVPFYKYHRTHRSDLSRV